MGIEYIKEDKLLRCFIGVDMASGPDRTVIRCGACGWCGETKDVNRDKDGKAICPICKTRWANEV